MDAGGLNWGLLVGSHLIRSWAGWSHYSSLEAEISSLRVEVFRARELVTGFNQVLEACEKSNFWLRTANQGAIILLFVIFVSVVCWVAALRVFKTSEHLVKPEIHRALPAVPEVVAPPVVKAGPCRPSDRLRIKEERA